MMLLAWRFLSDLLLKSEVLNQGVRNANDGISLAQTAEGALKEVTSNLQRIRDWQFSQPTRRTARRTEPHSKQKLLSSLLKLSELLDNTKFNGIALFDGNFFTKAFQVGADAAETVSSRASINKCEERLLAIGWFIQLLNGQRQGVGRCVCWHPRFTLMG